MTGFKPRFSDVEGDGSTNCATTTGQGLVVLVQCRQLQSFYASTVPTLPMQISSNAAKLISFLNIKHYKKLICVYHPAAPGLSPKHIYMLLTFIVKFVLYCKKTLNTSF